jgi:hypothetical protein
MYAFQKLTFGTSWVTICDLMKVKVSLVLVDDYAQVIFSVWEFTSSLIFLA